MRRKSLSPRGTKHDRDIDTNSNKWLMILGSRIRGGVECFLVMFWMVGMGAEGRILAVDTMTLRKTRVSGF